MVACVVTDSRSQSEDKPVSLYCCRNEFGIFVTKSTERTQDPFESKRPPFCLTFFHSVCVSACDVRVCVCVQTTSSVSSFDSKTFRDRFSVCIHSMSLSYKPAAQFCVSLFYS